MNIQNLVLEIGENESAADVQARLNKAAGDGFFLVNVVGRLAFLRTTVTRKKPEDRGRKANADGMEDAALAYIAANMEKSAPTLVDEMEDLGIHRKETWVKKAKRNLAKGSKISEG